MRKRQKKRISPFLRRESRLLQPLGVHTDSPFLRVVIRYRFDILGDKASWFERTVIGVGARVMSTDGADPGRVAEVFIARNHDEPSRRGSGYLLDDQLILTAAHVLNDSAAVTVRFNAGRSGEWTAGAEVEWSDQGTDLAILKIPARDGPRATPIRWGTMRDADAVVSFSAVGFPRFKLREDRDNRGVRYRDRHHAVGTIAALSNS